MPETVSAMAAATKAFAEMNDHVDGWNWYWLSYGEKCYAYAVVTAFPFKDGVPSPPAGSFLTPHETKDRMWVADDGTEMMVDQEIAAIEQQNGAVICEFIAKAYGAFQQRAGMPEPVGC